MKMEQANVSTSRLNEETRPESPSLEGNAVNIDATDGDAAAAMGVHEDETSSSNAKGLVNEGAHTVQNSELVNLSSDKNSSKVTGDIDAADSADQNKEGGASETSLSFYVGNNNDGPVFPARHNRELQPVSNTSTNSVTQPKSDESDVHNIDNATQKVLLSYIDTGEKGINLKKECSNDPVPEPTSQDPVENNVHDNFTADCVTKEGPSASIAETENESLAPLSASFFNCQYQTPSWIDDPLIGVPPCAMENKNTHRKTGADMRILTAYMRSLNEMRLPEAIPPTELDKYLSSFFLVVRKADGSEYEPCSLRAMLASIERYLRFKNYPLSLTRDSAFSNMRNVLKLKQQTLRSIGKGQKAPSDISPSSLAREGKIAHLFKSQEMGPYTPSSVVFTLCFYFCMYLRIRKSTENKKLLWGDIILCKDESGREFLTFSSQMLRRSQGSSKGNARQRSYRVWADPSCPEKDPVTIYKFYAQKRPSSMNTNFAPFYLGINVLYPTQGQLWYRPAAMGINKLNEMVRQIRDITGIRSSAEFHNDMKMSEKQGADVEMVAQDGHSHSPLIESADRQDSESEIKTEVMDDVEEDDGSSGAAVDFSQEQPLNFNQSSELVPPPSHQTLAALGNMAQAVYSDGESNDSYSHQSFPTKMNGDIAVDSRNEREFEQEIDLSKANSPDSPLNCSTKDRGSYQETIGRQNCSDAIGVEEAKQHLMNIMRRMEPSDMIHFNSWLKGVKFSSDPFSGQVVCKEGEDSKDAVSVKTSSTSMGTLGANIILNISLSPQALQGEGPITVTAQTSIPPEQQRNNSSSIGSLNGSSSSGKGPPHSSPSRHGTTASAASSTKNPLSFPRNVTGSPEQLVSSDKPLDLVTSPVNRAAGKAASSSSSSSSSSSQQQQSKMSRPHSGSNGIFPSMTGGGASSRGDSPLAKRLRLSAEQAEAYTSASIMASLSSASFLNERLRLQLMQAGLHMGDYSNLDPHASAGLMDLANSEALRSQLMQRYGIKSEPK